VTVPLAGSGVQSTDVYARRIMAGWAAPPARRLRHFRLTLESAQFNTTRMTTSEPGARTRAQMSFFFVNVDRSPDEWIRLSDHALNSSGGTLMQSVTAPEEVPLTDAYFDFYVEDGRRHDSRHRLRRRRRRGGLGPDPGLPGRARRSPRFLGARRPSPGSISRTSASPGWRRSGRPEQRPFKDMDVTFTRDPATGDYGVGSGVVPCILRCDVILQTPIAPVRFNDIPCDGPEHDALVAELDNLGYPYEFDNWYEWELNVILEEFPVDSDGDGLLDDDEVNVYGTDPRTGHRRRRSQRRR